MCNGKEAAICEAIRYRVLLLRAVNWTEKYIALDERSVERHNCGHRLVQTNGQETR